METIPETPSYIPEKRSGKTEIKRVASTRVNRTNSEEIEEVDQKESSPIKDSKMGLHCGMGALGPLYSYLLNG
jgi:hypothetical protein